jgi:long-chain acyl-CoA synthetase
MKTLFGSDVCLKGVLSLIKNSNFEHNLQQVVVFDKEASEDLKNLASAKNISILFYNDLIEKHRQDYSEIDCKNNKLSTIFTISYTSGTTGGSKGVMLSNANFLSAITNILRLADTFKFRPDDVYISYLPLAHVFDRLGCHTMFAQGGAIGFFGGQILQITADLKILKPTIFPSVPRLLNKVYDRVLAGVQEVRVTRRIAFY